METNATASIWAISQAATNEARNLCGLLRAGESPDDIRKLIQPSPKSDTALRRFRFEILAAFELALLETPPNQRRKRIRGGELPPLLRAQIVALLREGWTHEKIFEWLPVGHKHILEVSKSCGFGRRSRGRRFTEEERERIWAAVASGRRSSEIEREFGITAYRVTEVRRELGDFENRRHWKRLTDTQIAHAETLLRSGARWLDVARTIGVALATLQKSVTFRKRGVRLKPEETQALEAAVSSGQSQAAIARECGVSVKTVRRVQRKAGLPARRFLTPEERQRVVDGLRAGRTNIELAREFKIDRTRIWQIKQEEITKLAEKDHGLQTSQSPLETVEVRQ